MERLKLTPVKMMNAGEILELPPRLARGIAPALSHKLRTFLQHDCTKLRDDGSAEIHLREDYVEMLLVEVREECEPELKGLLPAGVQGDSVGGDVLAQLCFCLLLTLAPSLPLPLHVAQSHSLTFYSNRYRYWPWLSSECGEQALEVLCSALMSQHWSTPLRHLEMYRWRAFGTERACQHVAHLLKSTHCKLQSLNMSSSGTTAKGTSHIARALQANTSLIKLNLAYCDVGDKGVEQLATMLRNNSTIQELSLTGIGMTGEGVGHLRDALVSQSQAVSPPSGTGTRADGLKMLDISMNKIGQAGAVHLGAILANNRCSLRNLIVKKCELEDEAGCLGEGLRTNNTLEELDIRGNSIGKKAMEALVRGLAANNTSALKILKTTSTESYHRWATESYPLISSMGQMLPAAELMASMISSNQSLQELDLSEAPYSATEWATIILPALGRNKTLTSIHLRYCEGLEGKQVEAAFFDLLRINTTIQTLELDGTPLSSAGKAESIHEELRRKKNFKNVMSAMTQGKPKSCRLILCGNAYAGKSTLFQAMKAIMQINAQKTTCFPEQPLARLVCGQSSHDRELHKRTRGIEIHLLKENEDLRLSVWDLAGQREFHALHDFILPSGDSAAAFFVLTYNPIVSPGDNGAGKMKGESQLKEELLYWLRLVASIYPQGALAPSVAVVITNKDRLMKLSSDVGLWLSGAQDIICELRQQFEGLVNVREQPFLVNALSRQDPELKKCYTHMEQSLMSTLKNLPMEPIICTHVLETLQRVSQAQGHPIIPISEFAHICSEFSSKEPKKDLEGVILENYWVTPIASCLHNSGEIIYHEKLDFIVSQPRWFGHGVLGQLIDIFSCQGQHRQRFFSCFSKLAQQQERPRNGFVKRGYLNGLLQKAVKSIPGMNSDAVTSDQLIHLMLLLNLCYEERPGDPNTGYLLPAIFDDEDNKAADGKKPRTWRTNTFTPTHIGRRLQCSDIRTFLTDGFFPRLQVVLHNHAHEEKWVTTDNRDCCILEKNLVSMWVNAMDILIEFSGSSGSFVDIMVKSNRPLQYTMEFMHANFIDKIRSFCASHEGCQGVALEERIIRPECLRTNRAGPILCLHRKDQSITVEELRRQMEMTLDYEHSWGEVKDETGVVLLQCSADLGAALLGRPSGTALLDERPSGVGTQALSREQLEDCYPESNVADGQKRGVAVLISMEKYDSGDRLGGAVDRGRLEALACTLSLELIALVDSSAAELREQLVTIQEEDVLPKDECFVCFLNAHGNTNEDGEHFITDRVGQSILLGDIVGPFRTCKKLRGKPKMFVVNSCRGTNKVVGADAPGPSSDQPAYQPTEGNEKRYVEDLADCLVAFSTFGGSVSARDPMSGTIFVKALVEAFNSKRHNTDVFNIISSVNCAVVHEDNHRDAEGEKVRQCPIVVSSLTKRFFLR